MDLSSVTDIAVGVGVVINLGILLYGFVWKWAKLEAKISEQNKGLGKMGVRLTALEVTAQAAALKCVSCSGDIKALAEKVTILYNIVVLDALTSQRLTHPVESNPSLPEGMDELLVKDFMEYPVGTGDPEKTCMARITRILTSAWKDKNGVVGESMLEKIGTEGIRPVVWSLYSEIRTRNECSKCFLKCSERSVNKILGEG